MGEVYRARDTRLGREVAIKTLPANLAGGGEHLARFRREARAASALNHPHICTIFDLCEDPETPFIVMELLKGETLSDLLVRGPLALDRALALCLQLADALEAAHAEGIIHRDIKPANIFVTTRGDAKILDFGVARIQHAAVDDLQTEAADFITHGNRVIGTVAYMSPEQARGEPPDSRTDLFSLGVVLYEMTTGRLAFPGPTTAVIFNRILSSAVDPATAVNPALPKALDALFTRVLAKERDRRYSTARELRDDLQALRREPTSRQTTSAPGAALEKPSIVVLPFENLSADPDNEFFSDGLTDEIITDLSQIRTLRVISRNSSMQLKGAGKDLKPLVAELGVRYVLSGSVRKSGSAVRITSQLVDPVNVYASGELGRVYGGLGRDRDSSAMMDLARREDPLSPIHHHGPLWNALLSGNPALVVREAPRVLQSVPEFAMVRWDLAVALIQEDRLDDARDVLAAAPPERVPTIAGRVCVALKLALEGRRTEALTCIGEHLSTCAWNVEYWSWQVAECYAVAGAQDEALDWLENATRRGFVHYPFLSRSRTFRSLHGNPRFEQLSAGVKATWEEMQRLPL
jgi:serine/threonine protein kinase